MSVDYEVRLQNLNNYLENTPVENLDSAYIVQSLDALKMGNVTSNINYQEARYLYNYKSMIDQIFNLNFLNSPVLLAYVFSPLEPTIQELETLIEEGKIDNIALVSSITNKLKLLLKNHVKEIVNSNQSDLWSVLFHSHYHAFNTNPEEKGLQGYGNDPELVDEIYEIEMNSILNNESIQHFNQPIIILEETMDDIKTQDNDAILDQQVEEEPAIEEPEEKDIKIDDDSETEEPEEYLWDETFLADEKQTCYDQFYELDDLAIKNHITDDVKDKIIILEKPEEKKPIKVDCYSRSILKTFLEDPSRNLYECKTYSLNNVIRNPVYVLLTVTSLGNIILKKKEILGAISELNNYTLILEKVREVPRLVSAKVLDYQGSFVSSKHCNDGSGAPLYKIWKCGGDKCLKSVFLK